MKITFLLVAITLAGCASANKLTRLNKGMTKAETVAVMGQPTDTELVDGAEYFRYWLTDNVNVGHHYVIRFVNGKLESYRRSDSNLPLLIVR